MIERSKHTGKEIAAAILEDGSILVFHDKWSVTTNSKIFRYDPSDKLFLFINDKRLRVSNYVHTHPTYSSDMTNPLCISPQDDNFYKSIGKDVRVIMVPDGKLWGVVPYEHTNRYEIKW